MSTLIIKPRSRLFHGHEWVYASDIANVRGTPQPGEVVTLMTVRGKPVGSAIYNPQSQIVARRFSRQKQSLDPDFFIRRLTQAAEYRTRLGINPKLCRLVWSESDGLPGVIVDRYNDALVVQTLTLAMDQHLSVIAEALEKVFSPSIIIERNDAPIRQAEGMEPRVGILSGTGSTHCDIVCAGLYFSVDLLQGQKTGFYLDQIANYSAVAKHAHGKRVLDCFSNQGAFALACAHAGAKEVIAVEISEDCADLIRENARRNRLSITVETANAFDFLNAGERTGALYDLIILDPPSFTRNKEKLQGALRGYKEIHLRSFKQLEPDGLLATFSCSHHITDVIFNQVIVDALVDAKKTVRQQERFSQSPDHPILPTLPESEYLKGYLLEMAPGR